MFLYYLLQNLLYVTWGRGPCIEKDGVQILDKKKQSGSMEERPAR